MSDARSTIFDKIRAALPPEADRPAHPGFETEQVVSPSRLEGDDLWEVF